MVGRLLRVTGTALVIAVTLFTSVLVTTTASTAATTPPTTSVLSPANGATVSAEVLLDAGASSPVGISSVSFEVSGGSISDQVVGTGTPTLYGYIGGWDTTDVPNGTYTLQSVATDTTGVSTTSAPVTVTVDNPPPSTTVIIPVNGFVLDPSQGYVLDALASPGATSVSFVAIIAGIIETELTATPTIYGWIYAEPASQPLCSPVCTPYRYTLTIQSVATYAGGVSVTSPVVSGQVVIDGPK